MTGLAANGPRWSGLLSPQGKALFDFCGRSETGFIIDCEAAQAGALARRLSIYRLRRAISIEPVAGAVHWSLSPIAAGAVPDPRLAALGYRWLGAAGETWLATDWRAHRLGLGVTGGVNELGMAKRCG